MLLLSYILSWFLAQASITSPFLMKLKPLTFLILLFFGSPCFLMAQASSSTNRVGPILPKISMAFVTVGDANNDSCNNYLGAVQESYRLGRKNVTAKEYCAFLNAVATKDPFGLYDERMFSDATVHAIIRVEQGEAFYYFVVSGQEESPIVYVSWLSAARFCNWLQNGQQGPESTEDGAYTIHPENNGDAFVGINVGATYFLPSPNQWYKATYYRGGGLHSGYFYPEVASIATWRGAYGIEELIGGVAQWLSSDFSQYGPCTLQNWKYWESPNFKDNQVGFRVAAMVPKESSTANQANAR